MFVIIISGKNITNIFCINVFNNKANIFFEQSNVRCVGT